MSAGSVIAGGRTRVDWRRAEFVLTLLGFLAFLALPIRITTIYSGLPAHPLFVHVPVILIPATVVAAVVFMIKTDCDLASIYPPEESAPTREEVPAQSR